MTREKPFRFPDRFPAYSKRSFRTGATWLLACALSWAVHCGPPAPPPLDAAKVFADIEKAVDAAYINPTNDFAAAYQAASTSDASSLEGLVSEIQALPDEERRAATYRSIGAFLKKLSFGENNFVKPESLIWSRDPARKAGVGLVIRREPDGRFFIIDTLEGSASHRDGVKTGVYLNSVDGVAVGGLDQAEVIGRIKGEADTDVKITTDSGAHTLVRGQVVFRNILNAPWKTRDGGQVEYVALRSTLPAGGGFPGTANQMRDLLIPMKTRRAVIIDLRKLHLGDIEESFRVADLFVSAGTLGTIRARNRADQTFQADTDQLYTGPIYVIVGRHSSPQAQTMAMAMQTSPLVKLIGAPTKGEAFLSASREIAGGIELQLTTGFVLRGDGRPFYESGLQVDFPVADVLPAKPPLKQPFLEDPAQAKLAEILNIN